MFVVEFILYFMFAFIFAVMFSFAVMSLVPSGQDIEKEYNVMAFHVKQCPEPCCGIPPGEPILHAAVHHLSSRCKKVTEADV